MRILQICSAREIGGGERHLADLANSLSRREHDVYAALAFIWDNRQSVQADLAEEHRISEEMRRRYSSKLEAKLAAVVAGLMRAML